MRKDAIGLFWQDLPPAKAKKEVEKREPPDPVWLNPDYLPHLEEALAFPVHVFTDQELMQAAYERHRLVFDVESYENYFLVSFRSLVTGSVILFEMGAGGAIDTVRLAWVMRTFTVVGFNSLSYDLPMVTLALAGLNTSQLKEATNMLITYGMRPYEVLRHFKVKALKDADHIDLIEVAPLEASLKIYGGRMHVPRMQDLPFPPDAVLSVEQMAIVRWYNVNSDLTATAFLHETLREQIELRESMGREMGLDLRSKSDAQIAEAVIGAEMHKQTGQRPTKPIIEPGTVYWYRVPQFIQFESALLQWALNTIATSPFVVGDNGAVGMPEAIAGLKLEINGSAYQMGIGGLHSTEKSAVHKSDDEYELIDWDVASYYPRIILNLGLFPHHMGPTFLAVYSRIVERRLEAKHAGNTVVADSLKITINGSFGKLGSKHSILYSPDLLIQVTVTGQLSLLMLIERLELSGIHVVSANTDGIVIKCPKDKRKAMDFILKQWQVDTGFELEGTPYAAIYSRDVNNYMAIKPDGKAKLKGAFANPWEKGKLDAWCLHKNPVTTICIEAVQAYLTDGTPLRKTVQGATNIRKFVVVRTVKGGAVKVWGQEGLPAHDSREELVRMAGYEPTYGELWKRPNQEALSAITLTDAYDIAKRKLAKPEKTDYLGKAIRWYYAKDVDGIIVYAKSGNKVPKSEGAKPLLDLPAAFPDDIDVDWYIQEAYTMLWTMGHRTDEVAEALGKEAA